MAMGRALPIELRLQRGQRLVVAPTGHQLAGHPNDYRHQLLTGHHQAVQLPEIHPLTGHHPLLHIRGPHRLIIHPNLIAQGAVVAAGAEAGPVVVEGGDKEGKVAGPRSKV
jgi:hypothetical protein